MKEAPHVENYLSVFPNYKHENRLDGFGCKDLSPKSIGPLKHSCFAPISEIVYNLENLHQGSKIFEHELNSNNNVKEEYLQKIREIYLDKVPHRHKYDRKILQKLNNNINIPKFSIYFDTNGNEQRYNYLQCRYFYCYFYEKFVIDSKNFKKLCEMINKGYNLNIIGYDGYNVSKSLYEHYMDTSKPFGHELVLYTMLVENDRDKYPWNMFYKKNEVIYKNVI